MITEKEILNKYPEIFRNKNKSPQESCMCWGLAVPEDWLPIIDELCNALQNCGFGMMCPETKNHVNKPQVIAEQVKSKFNQLRFYYRLEFDVEVGKDTREKYMMYYDGMIAFAENKIRQIENERGEYSASLSDWK